MLRRSIPILILIFLIVIFASRASVLLEERDRLLEEAQYGLSLTVANAAGALSAAGVGAERGDIERVLVERLPKGASQNGRKLAVIGADHRLLAGRNLPFDLFGESILDYVEGAELLFRYAGETGAMEVRFGDVPGFAVAERLPGRGGYMVAFQSEQAILSTWWRSVSTNVTLYVATSTILVILLYAYFSQASRAREADDIYTEANLRVELALSRGGCGLWQWDLALGRMYWSKSMYEILGYQAEDRLLTFATVAELVHSEDADLYDIARKAAAQEFLKFDRMFRMRHASGAWLWMRVRAEVVEKPGASRHLVGIAVDVTENHKLAARSQRTDRILRDAIESISESFVLWDADGKLAMCNLKFLQDNGIDADAELSGLYRDRIEALSRKPQFEQRLANEHSVEGRTLERHLADGRWVQINERRTGDGGIVSVGADITALKTHEERLTHSEQRLMATIHDLTLAKKAEAQKTDELIELNRKYADEKTRAEQANHAKSEFLANMSHELRTPLNAIIGFSDIMQSGMFGPLGSDRYVEYCRDIHQSGSYLLGVINDILDMSRIEAGRFPIERKREDLCPLIEEAVSMISILAQEKKLQVATRIDRDMTIFADRRAMKQILINLLSNAVKFTGDGGKITVRARKATGALVLTIEDTGCGISKEALKRIGNPFEQAQNQFTRNHTGSGLGLAISTSLARMHGGALKIRSREGKGTIVSVRIPDEKRAKPDAGSPVAELLHDGHIEEL